MEKKEAIHRWQMLEDNQPILPYFTPIAADAKGSTFGACGIRISGNPQFIDAVLSRLKDLIAAESGATRLSLARSEVKPVSFKNGETVQDKKWGNADTDAETCYIQIRERTARTRHRKVVEKTSPLPNLETEGDADVDTDKKPKTDHVHATIGGLSTGEVLWNDGEEENAVEEGKKW